MPQARLGLSKYVSVFVCTYADLCRDRRRRLRPHLYSDLCRDPYHKPYAALNRALFQKPFEKQNPALSRRLYGLKYRSLYDLVNRAPYRETWPPVRPVGR